MPTTTTTKKRKTSQKVSKSDAEKVEVSPVVRRTRRNQIIQEVIIYNTYTGHSWFLLIIGKRFCKHRNKESYSNTKKGPRYEGERC